MRRILVTGMSGTGKSSALAELERLGFEVVDTDAPGWTEWSDSASGYVWREERIAELLARAGGTALYVSGTVSNQGRFYDGFDAVVLLSAPADVLLGRIERRSTNPYGKTREQRELILRHLAEVEPLLRKTCTHEIDATQPLATVVDQLAALAAVSSVADVGDPEDGPPTTGPYLQTVSGRWVNPFDPDPDQIELTDIARALANQCRFGGHCRRFYSVAQHCVLVSELIEEDGGSAEAALAALMHDAAEAYLGDLPHPIKHRSELGAAFIEAEKPLERVIRDRFSIADASAAVKRIDRALLATERRAFSAERWHWPELAGVVPVDLELDAWSPDEAAEAFVRRFEALDARRRTDRSTAGSGPG